MEKGHSKRHKRSKLCGINAEAVRISMRRLEHGRFASIALSLYLRVALSPAAMPNRMAAEAEVSPWVALI